MQESPQNEAELLQYLQFVNSDQSQTSNPIYASQLPVEVDIEKTLNALVLQKNSMQLNSIFGTASPNIIASLATTSSGLAAPSVAILPAVSVTQATYLTPSVSSEFSANFQASDLSNQNLIQQVLKSTSKSWDSDMFFQISVSNESNVDEKDNDTLCRVCGDESDGIHYGVRSCRGCNAFFRRAITEKLTYICKRGSNCNVSKNARCACRACRLRKCKAVGMDARAVQPKRDGNNALRPATSNGKDEQMDSESLNVTDSEDWMPLMPISPPPEASRLVRNVFEYAEQRRRRQVIMCTTLEEVLNSGKPKNRIASPEDLIALFRAQMILCFDFVHKISDFKLLSDHDKFVLLRLHVFDYMMLDDLLHTVQLGEEERYVMVNNTYLQEGVYYNGPGKDNFQDKVLRDLGGPWISDILRELVLPWIALNINETEMITIRMYALFSWNEHLRDQKSSQIIEKAQNDCKSDYLHYYSEECGGSAMDGMQRLAMLLDFASRIKKFSFKFYSIIRELPNLGLLNKWESHYHEKNLKVR